MWQAHQLIYGVDQQSLYDKEIYINHYESHNNRVNDYFRNRSEDLLELNLADSDAMQSLFAFLGIKATNEAMPHLNSSIDID